MNVDNHEIMTIWFRLQEIFWEAVEDPELRPIVVEAMSYSGLGTEPESLIRLFDLCDPVKSVDFFFESNPTVTIDRFESLPKIQIAEDLLCLFKKYKF